MAGMRDDCKEIFARIDEKLGLVASRTDLSALATKKDILNLKKTLQKDIAAVRQDILIISEKLLAPHGTSELTSVRGGRATVTSMAAKGRR